MVQKTSIPKIATSSLNLGNCTLQMFTSSIKAAVLFWLSVSEKEEWLEYAFSIRSRPESEIRLSVTVPLVLVGHNWQVVILGGSLSPEVMPGAFAKWLGLFLCVVVTKFY